MTPKVQQALKKQDEYVFQWGNLNDVPFGDEVFNDLTRKIIAAFKEDYPTVYMGKLVLSWEAQRRVERGELGIYTEYTGQQVPAYGCEFLVPTCDLLLEQMVKKWVIEDWPPDFGNFTAILRRIEELGGITLSWR